MYMTVFRQQHPSIVPIPRGGYFQDLGYRYLVMEKLSDSLGGFLKTYGPFSPPNLALVATQVVRHGHEWLTPPHCRTLLTPVGRALTTEVQISVLGFVHGKGIVFRDIKPDNFMIGAGDNRNRVYIIDFGCAERIKRYDGSYQQPSENGTPTYFSLNTHNQDREWQCWEWCAASVHRQVARAAPAPRDDLEGAGYMFVELAGGTLPWANSKSAEELARKKQAASIQDICDGCPGTVIARVAQAPRSPPAAGTSPKQKSWLSTSTTCAP